MSVMISVLKTILNSKYTITKREINLIKLIEAIEEVHCINDNFDYYDCSMCSDYKKCRDYEYGRLKLTDDTI